MKTLSVIDEILSIVVTLAVAIAIIVGTFKFMNLMDEAFKFRSMDTAEKAYTWMTDREKFNSMERSYEIMASIPILGETL